jgi:hypothetical protein
MKRFWLVLLLIGVLFSPIFGAATEQKIYPVDSEPFQIITSLYITQGLALPSTAGPHSGDELMKMLDRIDVDRLSPVSKNLYQQAYDELYRERKVVTWGLEAALEAYIHKDTTNFIHEEDWVRGYDERAPILNIKLETFPSKHFYGYSELPVNNTKYTGYDANTGTALSLFFGESRLTTNLFFLSPGSIQELDLGMPYRAFGAFGGENWSVQIGRDKLSWGAGKTGNFMLSDSFKYHNTGRFTSYGKNFKYSLVTSFFPHPAQYHDAIIAGDDDTTIKNFLKAKKGSQEDKITGLYMFLGHRLEGRLFDGKVGLALSESIMYQSKDNLLDLRILNPSMIYHNYYIRSNSNSLLTFEVDYTPIPYLNVYGQMAVDEFAMVGEPFPGKDKNAHPSAYGFMLGAQTAIPVHKGLFTGSLEFVKTDPYLYLRYGDTGNTTQKLGEWGISYLAAIREHYAGGGHIIYQEEFLGYPFGPDAIVINANAGYKEFGSWNVSTNFFYMWHGTHDKWTLWSKVQPEGTAFAQGDDDKIPYIKSPTDKHWTKNQGDPNYDKRDSVAKTLIFGVKGGYTILPGFEVYAQTDLIHIVNPKNISANPAITDLQLTVGLSYSL